MQSDEAVNKVIYINLKIKMASNIHEHLDILFYLGFLRIHLTRNKCKKRNLVQ